MLTSLFTSFMPLLCCFAQPSQPQANTFLGQGTTPNTVFTALSEFVSDIAFVAETSSTLCKYDLQISLLAADPSLDKASRVFGEGVVELALGIQVCDFLYQKGNVVVHGEDGFEVCEMRR